MPGHSKQRCIAVLGPGRCGTSTVARGLISLGVPFGDRLKPAARKNPRGFFEDLDLLDINYRVHESLGLRRNGSSVACIPADAWDDDDLHALVDRAAQLIRRRFGGHPAWGCKIGGMMRVMPFWERVFDAAGQDVAYVLAIRHPASVARSRAKLDPHRAIQEKSDLEFAVQILPHFESMARRHYVVVDYDRVMEDPKREMHRIADALRLPMTDAVEASILSYASDFVASDLRHNQTVRLQGTVGDVTWRLYRLLRALAEDQGASDAPRALRQLSAEFAAMGPALALIDDLEGRLRRGWPGLHAMLLAVAAHLPTAATLRDVVALSGGRSARASPRQGSHANSA